MLIDKITGKNESKAKNKNQAIYRQDAGSKAEQLALDYLLNEGLKQVRSNYRTIHGEIDLILLDQNTLVFVEVRYRKTDKFMTPEETVNFNKQRKIVMTAKHFICKHNLPYNAIRFDVVTILGDLKIKPRIKWLQAAFEDID